MNVGSVHEEEWDAHLNHEKYILYLYKKQIQREDADHKSLVGLNCRHFYDLYLDGSVVILALLLLLLLLLRMTVHINPELADM